MKLYRRVWMAVINWFSVRLVDALQRRLHAVQGNRTVCINIFARLNAQTTLIAVVDGCHSPDTPGREPFSRIWPAANAWPLKTTAGLSAVDILKPLSVIGACPRPSHCSRRRRCTLRPFQRIDRIVEPGRVLQLQLTTVGLGSPIFRGHH